MPHFSRLTDIVTCNLTEILDSSADPVTTLREILMEMEEGIAACRRTVSTSARNAQRLNQEIADHQAQIQTWMDAARDALGDGHENDARTALSRKVELDGLVEALRPELDAAESTQQHMLRIQKALEARHADAARRLLTLQGGPTSVDATLNLQEPGNVFPDPAAESAIEGDRRRQVDAALEELRRQLGKS